MVDRLPCDKSPRLNVFLAVSIDHPLIPSCPGGEISWCLRTTLFRELNSPASEEGGFPPTFRMKRLDDGLKADESMGVWEGGGVGETAKIEDSEHS